MLTLYRSNRAEFLAQLLAQQLLEQQPGPLETVEVLVNTWPTSRWLGNSSLQPTESAHWCDFHSRKSSAAACAPGPRSSGGTGGPLACQSPGLVGARHLPAALERPEAASLQRWLQQRGDKSSVLSRDRWQLARTIADAYDDYALYRPETLHQWANANLERTHSETSDWQPWLWRELARPQSSPANRSGCRCIKRLSAFAMAPPHRPPCPSA